MANEINLKKIHSGYKSDKAYYDENWRDHHKELQENLMPRTGENLDGNTGTSEHGQKLNEKMMGSAPRIAARVLSDGIKSSAVPATGGWYELGLGNKELLEQEHIKAWIEAVQDEIYGAMNQSNFYTVSHDLILEMVVYGTGAMFIEADFDSIIWCQSITAGTYFVGVDHKGRINRFNRLIKMQARNVVAMFGEENVSQAVREDVMGQDKVGAMWVDVIHIIKPNDGRDITKIDAANKAYLSVYYEADKVSEGKPLRVSGFDMNPAIVARWSTKGSELYGRGPGMDILPDVKELYYQIKAYIKLVRKGVSSAKVADASLKTGSKLNQKPDSVIYVKGLMDGRNPPIQNADVSSLEARWLLERIRQLIESIQSGMYNDLFLLLTSSNVPKKDRTAFEVARVEEEKLVALGRVMENMTSEFIHRAIDIIFEILFKAGRIPPPPVEIAGQDIKVEAISSLAKAQRLNEFTPIQQTLSLMAQLIQLNPNAVKKLDEKQVVDLAARAFGAPVGMIKSDETVALEEQAEAEELLRQQALAEENESINQAKTLSETDTQGDNALTRIAGGLQ